MEDLRTMIREAADYLRSHGIADPEIGIVLGTGLNEFADRIENPICLSYGDIPHFTKGAVEGHRSQVIYGEYEDRKVIIMAGRFHYYECHSMARTTFPARVMVELGIRRIIITNASGCINENWNAGDFMAISDHINMSGDNPLIGENLEEYGTRFPDMCDTYDRKLRERLIADAASQGIALREGVYAMMTGPSFETPAEIRFLRTIGADAVGMSSVPEAIVCNHAGLEIIGISLLSNMAAGILNKPITGEEVNETSSAVADTFNKILDLAIAL